jgi:predicted nuclease of predicted toxin-antitoxin system
VKFLIDINLSPLWVGYLESHGFEAVHWSTVGNPSAADSEIFEFAAAGNWIVFTHDLDFGLMLATLRTSAPKMRSQDVLPSAMGDVVVRAIRVAKPYFEAGVSSRSMLHVIAFGCCRYDCVSALARPLYLG